MLYLVKMMNGDIPQIIKDVGFDFHWSSRKVWALNEPTIEIDINDLLWHFDIPFWEKEGTNNYNLPPWEVIKFPENEPTHARKVELADTSHPIDIMENKGRWLILDGLHRLVKLYMKGDEKIKVRKIPRERIPEILTNPKINIYIDGNNLYRGAKELGFDIDYKKFRGWLRQKYNAVNAYLFIGLVPDRVKFYEYLQECGFILVFKQTVTVGGVVKGNCDAELVLKSTSDFYTKLFDLCLLITGDGDFGCLVEFLVKNHVLTGVLAPDEKKCSFLLRNKNIEITFLNEHYHKFAKKIIKEKAPDADVSA